MRDTCALSRRHFLRLLGGAAASVGMLSGTAPLAMACSSPLEEKGQRTLGPIGIQLYTVRTLMDRDVEGTLAALARIGYAEVELAGLHGKTAREMRAILDRHGLKCPSSHISMQDIRERWPAALDDAHALGQRYIVCPWIDESDRTPDGYRRVAAELNRAGETALKSGVQLAYHNHDYEFAPIAGGIVPYDLLLAECDPSLVRMELDLYWIVKAGGDPLTYFASHPGRFPLVHAKDITATGQMVDVGKGTIDFRAIFARTSEAGIAHVFVEHDDPPSPLDDVRESYEYLRHLRY
ncbi:MAG TPA: sugar phosphate isomerase/epimerase [Gemmatimonadaceae bacterium]|nr:sugar phosphate isomerase/epimerase [Gemmatimonadaceae bacterium]